MSVLLAVYKKNGIPRREMLSESYGEETGTGVAIKTLDKKGHIKRKRDPNDNRAQLLYITEEGLALKKDLIEINRALEYFLTRDLSRGELELFKRVMGGLCSELQYTIRWKQY